MQTLNKLFYACLIILSTSLFFQKTSIATVYILDAPLSGAQEVPPSGSTGLGVITGTYDDVTFILSFDLVFTGLLSTSIDASLHAPAGYGGVATAVIPLVGFPAGVTTGFYTNTYALTAAQNLEIVGGLWYVNINTVASPTGEIRGQLVEGTLPVELLSFVSNVFKNDVTLNWSTARESNNSGFDIERSINNQWSKIGLVNGSGTTNSLTNYSYTDRNLNSGKYNYRLKQIDFNGNFEYFNLSNEVVIGVPSKFHLFQNYPNPFNPFTKIDYEISINGNVNISIFDNLGKKIVTLVNEVKTAGYYSVNFNASNLSSGVYFYTLAANNLTATNKMLLIK